MDKVDNNKVDKKPENKAQNWTERFWNEDHPSPKKEIACRHCGARNRVLVSKAVISPEKYLCAKCAKPLFLAPDEPLTAIPSRVFEHAQDASTLRALKAIPGASSLLKLLYKHLNERAISYQLTANAIQCGEDQFPELVRIVMSARDRLGCTFDPVVYFTSMPFSNAFTSGSERAIVCFSTAILNQLTDAELLFVTGHELGHLMSEHAVARMLMVLLANGGLVMLPGIARLISLPIQMALMKWSRCSELTADRAGLLACRDVTVVLHAMMKMAGGNDPGVTSRTELSVAAFVSQAKELAKREDSDQLDNLTAIYFTRGQTHPYVAWRVLELLDWVENGNYLNILSGDYL